MENEVISNLPTQAKRETNLRDWLLCSANDAEERAEHTKQGEDGNGDGTSSLRLRFDGKDGVNLGQLDKLEDCLADERNRGSSKGRLRNVSILLECIFHLLFCGLLDLALDVESFLSEGFGVLDGVADIDVAEENIFGHRPEFDADTANLVKGLNRGLVLKEAGVGDLAGGPDTLIRWVVNLRSEPFALVVRVGFGGAKIDTKSASSLEIATWDSVPRPRATSGSRFALGVLYGWRDPVTILLVIPLLRLLSLGVGNKLRLVLEPVIGFNGILIRDGVRSIFVPVVWLLGVGIGNLVFVDPVSGLLVLGIVDFGGRVDGRIEFLKKRATRDLLVINEDLEGLVGVDDEGIEHSALVNCWHGCWLEMLLLVLAGDGVLMAEDEVQLQMDQINNFSLRSRRAGNTHFGTWAGEIRTKHDHPRCVVTEFLAARLEAVFEQLEVATTAITTLLVFDLILDYQGLVGKANSLCERGRNAVVGGFGFRDETLLASEGRIRRWFLDLPLADVCECLAADGGLLSCL